MTDALAATEMVLAREQQLHALDGLAAAAAHELGTPLATITLVTKELARELPPDSPHRRRHRAAAGAGRALPRDPAQADAHAVRARSAARAHEHHPADRRGCRPLSRFRRRHRHHASSRQEGADPQEPVGERRPGVIYGLGNLVENAIDFARDKVEIAASWSAKDVTITIADDGQGIPPDVMDALGEPYITTRPSRSSGAGNGRRGVRAGPRLLHRQNPAGALRRQRIAGKSRASRHRSGGQGELAPRGVR